MDATDFFHIRDIVSRMSEFNFNRYFLEIIHRDLKSTSHKKFCNRILTIQGIILGHGESKKVGLSFCRNRNFMIIF